MSLGNLLKESIKRGSITENEQYDTKMPLVEVQHLGRQKCHLSNEIDHLETDFTVTITVCFLLMEKKLLALHAQERGQGLPHLMPCLGPMMPHHLLVSYVQCLPGRER